MTYPPGQQSTSSTTGLPSTLFGIALDNVDNIFQEHQELSPKYATGNLTVLEWEDANKIIVVPSGESGYHMLSYRKIKVILPRDMEGI